MPDEKDESSGFKVIDRRSFNSEGSRRDDDAKPKAAEPKSDEARRSEIKAESRVVQPEAESIRDEEHEPELDFGEAEEGELSGEPSGFETLVSYLSTTAMFQLGLMPGPGGERIPADMVNAQRTIDLLQVLQGKTQGNLTPQESRLLEDVLYELRMTFVELQKRQARKG